MRKLDDPEVKKHFLEALGRTGEIRAACAIADISYSTFRAYCEHDEEFRYQAARQVGLLYGKVLERGYNLAIDGTEHLTYDEEGNVRSRKVVHDTKLLLKILARHDRERWGDQKAVTVDKTVRKDIRITVVKPSDLTLEARERVRALLEVLPEVPQLGDNG